MRHVTPRRPSPVLFATALGAALAAPLGCSRAEPEPKPRTNLPAETSSGAPGPLVLARGVRIVHAGPGSDASQVIREQRDAARRDGRDLVVYVGAKWCEPCRAVHDAAQRGQLDSDFPEMTLLEFDLDEDSERLASAGYASQFIPLFVVPGADGRATDKRVEGSVKGTGAVPSIIARLRPLLRR